MSTAGSLARAWTNAAAEQACKLQRTARRRFVHSTLQGTHSPPLHRPSQLPLTGRSARQ